jgi:hypothetical protein
MPTPLPSVSAQPKLPAGWWKIASLTGERSKVIADIDSRADVPQWGKDVVKAMIAAQPADSNLFVVDAHSMTGNQSDWISGNLRITVQSKKAAL